MYRRETYDLTHGYLALHPIMMRIAFLSFEMSTTAPKFLMLETPFAFPIFLSALLGLRLLKRVQDKAKRLVRRQLPRISRGRQGVMRDSQLDLMR